MEFKSQGFDGFQDRLEICWYDASLISHTIALVFLPILWRTSSDLQQSLPIFAGGAPGLCNKHHGSKICKDSSGGNMKILSLPLPTVKLSSWDYRGGHWWRFLSSSTRQQQHNKGNERHHNSYSPTSFCKLKLRLPVACCCVFYCKFQWW
jgi:hypothetical protein